MILTFKIKHENDFTTQLKQAKQIADFSVLHKNEKLSSKDVKHFGLKSSLSLNYVSNFKWT